MPDKSSRSSRTIGLGIIKHLTLSRAAHTAARPIANRNKRRRQKFLGRFFVQSADFWAALADNRGQGERAFGRVGQSSLPSGHYRIYCAATRPGPYGFLINVPSQRS